MFFDQPFFSLPLFLFHASEVSQLSQGKANPKSSKSVTVSPKTAATLPDTSNCSMSQFEFCLLQIKSVTESDELAFASTHKQLKSACDRMQDGVKCADDHMRRCVSPGQWQLFEEVVTGTREVLVKLCVPGPVQRGECVFLFTFQLNCPTLILVEGAFSFALLFNIPLTTVNELFITLAYGDEVKLPLEEGSL